jgi:DNA-binding winged helix-turn-helix (wHTH) protein/TolB-like protein/Tfp pilus assembly protein PilF
MAAPVNVLYEFGPYQLDPPERLLLCDGQPVPITPKAFDLLVVLVERCGHLVEKDELLRTVWPGSFVEEGNLAVAVSHLRKALSDDRGHHKYIETVSKKGYRFVAGVKRVDDSGTVRVPVIAHEVPIQQAGDAAPEKLASPPVPATIGERWNRRNTIGLLAAVATVLLVVLGLQLMPRHKAVPDAPTSDAIHSLAVLPFQTLGTSKQDEYLGLGIADALITKLGNTGKIIVRPTSAIQQYAGTHLNPQAVGSEQKVDAVLDGRIQRDGDRVRLTLQLIRVRDGVQLWAESFDRQFTDIFALEDAVSEMAAQSVRLQLTGEETRKFTRRATEKPDAYEAYIKGRYFWNKRTDNGLKKGLEYFQRAIKLDPSFAEAYVGVADSYATLGLYAVLPPKEAFPTAKAAARRALEMDGSLAEAHASLGFIYFYYDWDRTASESEFQHALASNPQYAMAHSWYGESLAAASRYPEAISEAQRAFQDDPLSLIVSSNAGWTLTLAGQPAQSVDVLKKAIEIDATFPRTHFRLGQVYEQQRLFQLAIPEFQQAVELSGNDPYYEASLGHAYGASGNLSQAQKVLHELLARSSQRYVPPYSVALVYAGMGDRDQAFQWLEKAYEDRSTSMVFLRTDPELASLRSDHRFAQLSSRINF